MPFVWIIDEKLSPYLDAEGGISSKYLVPRNALNAVSISEITEENFWIVLRSIKGDYIFAFTQINQIEQFEEGLNSGDYLLSVAIDKSFRIASRTSSNRKHIGNVKDIPFGISKISIDADRQMRQFALSGVTINFRRPPVADLSRIEIPPQTSDLRAWTLRCLTGVTKKFSLDELWSVQGLKLPPFAAFAHFRIVDLLGGEAGALTLDALKGLDPTASLTEEISNAGDLKAAPPVVDTNFFLLEPDKIFARKFIAKKKKFISIKDVLAKIEAAEKTHQKMLREIAEYLISKGFQPKFSESIDMCIDGAGGIELFEIKSSTYDNFLDQVAKGLFQLICYADALEQEGGTVNESILVVQNVKSASLHEYANRIAKKCNVKILFFDDDQDWPEKVSGLIPIAAAN
ncbi:MAG: hypothetical protein JNM12_15415 [Alphaproteobacteria bacterium]|nr:hypothetical protein [Alphaproteobacteria bacterium]